VVKLLLAYKLSSIPIRYFSSLFKLYHKSMQCYKKPYPKRRFLTVFMVFGIVSILIGNVQAQERAPEKNANTKYVVIKWASDPAIAKGVAISLDDKGAAYVTTAFRRKESSLDIRKLQPWVKSDLSFTSVEDRRAFYHSNTQKLRGVKDWDGNGVVDWKDLAVQKDGVVQIIDKDRDGVADQFKMVDEYHTEVTGIPAGVLAVGSDLFVAAEPDFFLYTDQDGDGLPETRKTIATGLQVHIGQGGHNLSGLTLGPDGRVYISLADKGHSLTTKEGKTYHEPNSGAIFRCELDGSKFERYSLGERNAQELAFDAYGNLFSMDNDGDYPGEMERALYITEGSDHGWRLNWQWLGKQDFVKISGTKPYNPWMEEKLFLPDHDGIAAYLTPTIGNFGPGPCGFVANPGTAMSQELSDKFFMTNNLNEVRVFSFESKGASFKFTEHEKISGGNSNTGLAIGPDGALFAASYEGDEVKRGDDGSIYLFDVAKENRHPLREQTQAILKSKEAEQSLETLSDWLGHADQRARLKAQFELVRRGEAGMSVFVKQAEKSKPLLANLHAIWGIGQAARRHPAMLKHIAPFWKSSDPEVLSQLAKVVGDLRTQSSLYRTELRAGLVHSSIRVRFFSAIALGKCEERSAASELVALLASSDAASDAYLRHAGSMGIQGAMTPTELASLSTHENRTVRLAAIVALRRLKAPEVRAFLQDKDERVLLEAARAIHDDLSIPEALPDLANILTRTDLKNEALLRRVINAALRNGSENDLKSLADFLVSNKSASANIRAVTLASILWWSKPPVLDPVDGRFRVKQPRDPAPVNAVVEGLQETILSDAKLTEVLLRGAIQLENSAWIENVVFEKLSPSLQSLMLNALARVKDPRLKAHVEQGLASEHSEVRETARGLAKEAGIAVLDLLLAILDDPKLSGRGQGKAVLELAKLKDDPEANTRFQKLIVQYQAGKTPKEWQLEMGEAAKIRGIDLPATPERFEYGGDPKRGKKLVNDHPAAQCIRCHQIGKSANAGIGPNLSKIGKTRDRAQLVDSLLNPNNEITEGYGSVLLETKSGEKISGVLEKKGAKEWVVTLPDTTKKKVAFDQIKSHTLMSSMPPMGQLLDEREIRDIISYLTTLR
jgi:putative heme-binding domain-containing protein